MTKYIENQTLTQAFDPQWISPCQCSEVDANGYITWQPVLQEDNALSFYDVEQALGITIHQDIKDYYGCYWSDHIEATCDEGRVRLTMVWNADDFKRLFENLIGHLLNKHRAKQPLTLFFACTDEEEYFLSVDNQTGKVLLETPGLPPIREVASSLAEFLMDLQVSVSR